MKLTTRTRTLAIGVALATVSALAPAGIASAETPAPETPSAATPSHLSLLSLGDSTTRGFAACGKIDDCIDVSWSTGSNPAVNSFAQRLEKSLPGTTVDTANYAHSGSPMGEVPSRIQDAKAAGVQPDVITLLVGGNDLCNPAIPVASDGYTMTPVSDFRSSAQAAIGAIRNTWPSAKIELASLPNNASQWKSERLVVTNGWNGFCRTTRGVSASGAPLSAPAAAASVAAAAERLEDYNTVLEQTCSAAGPLCHWDGGALTRLDFTQDLLSTVDHFHPNIAGQAAIAEVEWNASSFSKSSN